MGSPMFLKMGSSVLARHGMRMSRDEAVSMATQVVATVEILDRVAPELRQSPYHHADREASRPRAIRSAVAPTNGVTGRAPRGCPRGLRGASRAAPRRRPRGSRRTRRREQLAVEPVV